MSGADVFTMEPEQVYLGIEELFAIEAEVDRLRKELYTEYVSVATVLAAGQYAIVEVLRLASGRWCHQRSLGFTGLVGVLGEYLAMCAAEAVEIDEFRSRLHYDNTSRDNMALTVAGQEGQAIWRPHLYALPAVSPNPRRDTVDVLNLWAFLTAPTTLPGRAVAKPPESAYTQGEAYEPMVQAVESVTALPGFPSLEKRSRVERTCRRHGIYRSGYTVIENLCSCSEETSGQNWYRRDILKHFVNGARSVRLWSGEHLG